MIALDVSVLSGLVLGVYSVWIDSKRLLSNSRGAPSYYLRKLRSLACGHQLTYPRVRGGKVESREGIPASLHIRGEALACIWVDRLHQRVAGEVSFRDYCEKRLHMDWGTVLFLLNCYILAVELSESCVSLPADESVLANLAATRSGIPFEHSLLNSRRLTDKDLRGHPESTVVDPIARALREGDHKAISKLFPFSNLDELGSAGDFLDELQRLTDEFEKELSEEAEGDAVTSQVDEIVSSFSEESEESEESEKLSSVSSELVESCSTSSEFSDLDDSVSDFVSGVDSFDSGDVSVDVSGGSSGSSSESLGDHSMEDEIDLESLERSLDMTGANLFWPFDISPQQAAAQLRALSERSCDFTTSLRWAFENLDNSFAEPRHAPSNSAWSILVTGVQDRKQFLTIASRVLTRNDDIADQHREKIEQLTLLHRLKFQVKCPHCDQPLVREEGIPISWQDGSDTPDGELHMPDAGLNSNVSTIPIHLQPGVQERTATAQDMIPSRFVDTEE